MKKLLAILIILNICLSIKGIEHDHDHGAQQLEFVANQNQWDSNVLYRLKMTEGFIFMEDNSFTYKFYNPEVLAQIHDAQVLSISEKKDLIMDGFVWKMNFLNALSANVEGEHKLSHHYNYFRGKDPSRWAGNVPVFPSITYNNIFEGINIKAYSKGSHFKYDWIIDEGADPSVISFELEGIENPYVDNGMLVIPTNIGDFHESKPYAYQIIDGVEVEVKCNYIVQDGEISYLLPDGYDSKYKLIIDPELIASTLSGSTGAGIGNFGHTATYDDEGNIYTGCISHETEYPTNAGSFQESYGGGPTDFGISKLSPDGSELIWASFVGGNGDDHPHSMVSNNLGELFVYGSTTSSDMPTTATAFQSDFGGEADIYVCHFNFDGSELIGGTYLGGSASDGVNTISVNYGDRYRGEIILDFSDKPVIASSSSSIDFPTSSGAYQTTLGGEQDAVLCRLNANLSNLELGTYVGGSLLDNGYGVKVAANGSIFLAGTACSDFPVTPGAYQTTFMGGDLNGAYNPVDGFVAKFNASGNVLEASTFLGTDSGDQIFFIDLDTDDNVFVFGQGGADFPIVGDAYINPNSPQFVAKINQELNDLLLSTTIGTGGTSFSYDFVPDAFLVDNCNNVYLSAYSAYSEDLALTPDFLYDDGGFYLAVFNEDMEDLEFGTKYTGGHVDGGTSRFDKNGTVYQAVCSGGGFATTADAYSPEQNVSWDVAVFKIDFDVSGVNSAIGGNDLNGCAPFETTFNNYSTGDQFLWDLGDGTTSTEFEPTHTYEEPGVYTVTLIASDILSCNLADTSSFELIVSTPTDFTPSFTVTSDCNDQSATVTNTTGLDFLEYQWDFGDGTIIEDYAPTHIYEVPGSYNILLTAIDNGCVDEDTVSANVNIFSEVVAVIDNPDIDGCAPFEATFDNASSGAIFTWDFGDGSPNGSGPNPNHIYTSPGSYEVTLIVEGIGDCEGTAMTTANVTVVEAQVSSAFSLQQTQGCEELFVETVNESVGEGVTYSWDFGDGFLSEDANPVHNYELPGEYTVALSIYDEICDQNFVAEQIVEVIAAEAYSLPDVPFCYHKDSLMVNANTANNITSYLWSNDETTSSVNLSEPGMYSVTAFINNCWLEAEFEAFPVDELVLEDTITICQDSEIILDLSYPGASNMIWCDVLTGGHLTIDKPGDYCYTFNDEYGCDQTGNYKVGASEDFTYMFIPNSFTPNEDGLNDLFEPVFENIYSFELSVYDRWGNNVFYTDQEGVKWNGTHQNQSEYYVPDGVYMYEIQYKTKNDICELDAKISSGTIMVFR